MSGKLTSRRIFPLTATAVEHAERLIDEALEETFPASDPISPAVDPKPGPANGFEATRQSVKE